MDTLEALFKDRNAEALRNYQAALSTRLEALLQARLQLEQFEAEASDTELQEAPLSGNALLLEKWEKIENKQLNFDARWPLQLQEREFFVNYSSCAKKESWTL